MYLLVMKYSNHLNKYTCRHTVEDTRIHTWQMAKIGNYESKKYQSSFYCHYLFHFTSVFQRSNRRYLATYSIFLSLTFKWFPALPYAAPCCMERQNLAQWLAIFKFKPYIQISSVIFQYRLRRTVPGCRLQYHWQGWRILFT